MKYLLSFMACVILSGCLTDTASVKYSQSTPQEALESIILASENRDTNYLKMHIHYSRKVQELIDHSEQYKDYDDSQIQKLIDKISHDKFNVVDDENKPRDLIWFVENPDELKKLRNGAVEDSPVVLGRKSNIPAVRISNEPLTKMVFDLVKVKNEWYYLVAWPE